MVLSGFRYIAGFGIRRPGHVDALKFVSLDGLGLDAVRDKHAAAPAAATGVTCSSGRVLLALQVS